jgi:hypothetical protein
MFKTSTILLSIALAVFGSAPVLAQYQYQDPRLAGQVEAHDGLDAIYDEINAQARQKPAILEKPVRDMRAYNQFMNSTGADLAVEQANTAKAAAARSNDAVVTGAYEQKRITDLATWERAQLQGSSRAVRRGRYAYTVPTNNPDTNNAYVYGGNPAAGELQNIDRRSRLGVSQSQENVNTRLQDNQALARSRDQALEDSANSLRDQVLSTQSSTKDFGLQGVGTNLYVRQYGKPDANLPPVHNAAARIVPMGSNDY